ncbi:MAG: sodium:proton exchanger, partial [Bacteroidetes bacterium]|nr:sodium:proton exchanger [Bacteroidota bacterium]
MADLINSVSAHWIIITIAGLVILSYFFNQLSRKFNVPSAILLIATGFIMKNLIGFSASGSSWIIPVLEVLGTVGLIMIVLEAALDLKLKKDKAGLIIKSFTVSLIILVVTSFFIAFIIKFFLDLDSLTALVYAVPLSIMSSAIVIPSVSNLIDSKREFLIYECTFSDIQGILLFYFLLDLSGSSSIEGVLIDSTIKILLTIV